MVMFKNPNDPAQPRPGLYEWYYEFQGKHISVYVGQAGKKDSPLIKSTLLRGVHEASYATFTSNKGKSIDTDFIVGTVLQHIEQTLKVQCVWEHIEKDPKQERDLCQQQLPLLQDPGTCKIYSELKCEHKGMNTWKITEKDIKEQKLIINRGRAELLRVFDNLWKKMK